ncbi:collagen alpha-1(I) chain-like [Haliaeetus albicilla]|uniref:collagen alpha-1(I) chain-like n=1 Tax=Haliaeetus albicilla TaxID=8969 RepID=UPI0037E87AF4
MMGTRTSRVTARGDTPPPPPPPCHTHACAPGVEQPPSLPSRAKHPFDPQPPGRDRVGPCGGGGGRDRSRGRTGTGPGGPGLGCRRCRIPEYQHLLAAGASRRWQVTLIPRSRKSLAEPGGSRRQLPTSRLPPREPPPPLSTGAAVRADRAPGPGTGALYRGRAPRPCTGALQRAVYRSLLPEPLQRGRAPELCNEAVHRDRAPKPFTGALHRGRAPSSGPHCGAGPYRSSRAASRIPSLRRGRAGTGETKIPGIKPKPQPRHRGRHPPAQPAPGPSREQMSAPPPPAAPGPPRPPPLRRGSRPSPPHPRAAVPVPPVAGDGRRAAHRPRPGPTDPGPDLYPPTPIPPPPARPRAFFPGETRPFPGGCPGRSRRKRLRSSAGSGQRRGPAGGGSGGGIRGSRSAAAARRGWGGDPLPRLLPGPRPTHPPVPRARPGTSGPRWSRSPFPAPAAPGPRGGGAREPVQHRRGGQLRTGHRAPGTGTGTGTGHRAGAPGPPSSTATGNRHRYWHRDRAPRRESRGSIEHRHREPAPGTDRVPGASTEEPGLGHRHRGTVPAPGTSFPGDRSGVTATARPVTAGPGPSWAAAPDPGAFIGEGVVAGGGGERDTASPVPGGDTRGAEPRYISAAPPRAAHSVGGSGGGTGTAERYRGGRADALPPLPAAPGRKESGEGGGVNIEYLLIAVEGRSVITGSPRIAPAAARHGPGGDRAASVQRGRGWGGGAGREGGPGEVWGGGGGRCMQYRRAPRPRAPALRRRRQSSCPRRRGPGKRGERGAGERLPARGGLLHIVGHKYLLIEMKRNRNTKALLVSDRRVPFATTFLKQVKNVLTHALREELPGPGAGPGPPQSKVHL